MATTAVESRDAVATALVDGTLLCSPVAETYQQLAQWISEGKLAQPIDSTYPLADITTALTNAMKDQRDGKVLLDCS